MLRRTSGFILICLLSSAMGVIVAGGIVLLRFIIASIVSQQSS